jgi:siroheme synthase (precorrin-2 oxidase/ferrochelatase)
VPARFAEGEVIVSVTAGSAALAVTIRNDLARRLDKRHAKMAHAMQTLRPAIRDSGLESERRAAVFRDLASDEAIATMDTGGIEQLRRWIVVRHPGLKL